jgi:hypothetical protein
MPTPLARQYGVPGGSCHLLALPALDPTQTGEASTHRELVAHAVGEGMSG